MYLALINLFPILVALIVGFNCKKFCTRFTIGMAEKVSNFSLYSLLILMGITVGAIPEIMNKLSLIGVNALCIAVASSLSIACVLKIFYLRSASEKAAQNTDSAADNGTFNIVAYIKDPLLLAGLVIIGFLAGFYKITPEIDYDPLISGLLYLLIFAIGVKLSYAGLNLREIFFNRTNIIMTCLTVLASYIGAAAVSLFLPLSFTHSLAVSSGFGWYTLSGILFTKMGDPLLGSVAFLCDLFREAIALLLIPALSRLGNGHIAIGVAGATAMDVTLPLIEKHCGIAYVPVALLSGGIITLIVPFLIPFFYSL
ncbi:lysine exporter LysO family protein [Enterobacteriaceae bacterium ESL0689]|nr:lysine exporter LysO family protein [Enterobacteriaceae bacterium ESL0689]